MAGDRLGIELAYTDELERLMTRNHDGIQFVAHKVEGVYSSTSLTILFRVPLYSQCLYGVRDEVSAENDFESPLAAVQSAGYAFDRIVELANALPIELPVACRPDDEGITWVTLWLGSTGMEFSVFT